jgi:hypothetical protein
MAHGSDHAFNRLPVMIGAEAASTPSDNAFVGFHTDKQVVRHCQLDACHFTGLVSGRLTAIGSILLIFMSANPMRNARVICRELYLNTYTETAVSIATACGTITSACNPAEGNYSSQRRSAMEKSMRVSAIISSLSFTWFSLFSNRPGVSEQTDTHGRTVFAGRSN